MIIWHLLLSMQDEIIKVEKSGHFYVQVLLIYNREDQLNFDLAATEFSW